MRKVTILFALALSIPALADSIPLWKFFEPFDMAQVTISPEGTYLAASLLIGDGDEQENKFQVIERSSGEVVKSFSMPEKQRVSSITWTDDETVLMSPARKVPNEEAYRPTGGLMKVSVQTGKTIDIQGGGGIVNMLVDDPDHVLIARLDGRFLELYKMHILSGAVRKITKAPALGFGFVLHKDFENAAFHVGSNDEGDNLVHYRHPNGEWELVEQFGWYEKGWQPLAPAFNENEFFTRDTRNPKGIEALGIYNTKTREHKEVYLDDTFDIGGLLTDRQGNVWGLAINHHFVRFMYLNNTHPLAQSHKALRRQFPERTVFITDYTNDYRTVVAGVSADNQLPEIVILDSESGSIDQITDRENEIGISRTDLATMNPFALKARDDTPIYGYLTTRPETPRPGPMVVVVHGGPLGIRDSWGLNGANQVLATNGYHVLQVNFRGSGGYGLRFIRKAFREWGGTMQDDVTDATLWAIEQGIADKDRICIMGGSYGAYAALMGAAKEPNLYQCAIGQSGIYDVSAIERMGDLSRSKASIARMREYIGRTREDRQKVSVTNFAGKIKADVLLIHGGQDRRTPPEHYNRMKEAFDRVGKQVETHYKGNQGHSWFGRDTIMDLYGRQLTFLNKNIGGSESFVQSVSATN